MINPWKKIITMFRQKNDVKFLRRRIAVLYRDLANFKLIFCTESEIEEAIREYEVLRAKTDECGWLDNVIEALEAELKRREMMRQEIQRFLREDEANKFVNKHDSKSGFVLTDNSPSNNEKDYLELKSKLAKEFDVYELLEDVTTGHENVDIKSAEFKKKWEKWGF